MTETLNDRAPGQKVFLSYAHDNESHVRDVQDLAWFLETRGVTVEFDCWRDDIRRDWYAWMLGEIESASFVIVVASPKYRAVGDGGAPGNEHRGVQAETAAIRELLYRDRRTWVNRILPVVLPGRSLDELPTFAQPYSASHFVLPSITDDGAEDLLRVLTGRLRTARPHQRPVPELPATCFNGLVDDKRNRRSRWITRGTLVSLLASLAIAIPPASAPISDVAAGHDWRLPGLDASNQSPPATGVERDPGTTPVHTGEPSNSRTAQTRPTGDRDGPHDKSGPASDGSDKKSTRGTLEILGVGHSFTSDTDRLTITARNSGPDPVFVQEINIYTDRGPQHGHGDDDTDAWHFLVPSEMSPGAPADDGSRRTHGTIAMSGTEFEIPVVGEGWVEPAGAWHRLLTFGPQKFVSESSTVSIIVDVPTTILLQMTSVDEPAGPMVERRFDYGAGSVFTYVEVKTPDNRAFLCDYLRTDRPPVARSICMPPSLCPIDTFR